MPELTMVDLQFRFLRGPEDGREDPLSSMDGAGEDPSRQDGKDDHSGMGSLHLQS